MVRFTLRPVYQIMYICTSWTAFSSHRITLKTSSVCCYTRQLTHFLPTKRFALIAFHFVQHSDYTHFTVNPHSLYQALLLQSLPEGVLRIRIFFIHSFLFPTILLQVQPSGYRNCHITYIHICEFTDVTYWHITIIKF